MTPLTRRVTYLHLELSGQNICTIVYFSKVSNVRDSTTQCMAAMICIDAETIAFSNYMNAERNDIWRNCVEFDLCSPRRWKAVLVPHMDISSDIACWKRFSSFFSNTRIGECVAEIATHFFVEISHEMKWKESGKFAARPKSLRLNAIQVWEEFSFWWKLIEFHCSFRWLSWQTIELRIHAKIFARILWNLFVFLSKCSRLF